MSLNADRHPDGCAELFLEILSNGCGARCQVATNRFDKLRLRFSDSVRDTDVYCVRDRALIVEIPMPACHDAFRPILGVFMLMSLVNAISAAAQATGPIAPRELTEPTTHRRAIEAAIGDQPMLTLDTMRHLYFRDLKANNNDIAWGSSAHGNSPTTTSHTGVRYVYAFCNTRIDGPIVYELPASAAGSSFFGSFGGAWFLPLVDLGTLGVGPEHGGKFLVLPPGYAGTVPPGYIAVRPDTYNVILFNRSLIAPHPERLLPAGEEFVKQIKVYPLSKAANPPSQRLVDISDDSFEPLLRYDEGFYQSLRAW